MTFPLECTEQGIGIRWRRDVATEERHKILTAALQTNSTYEDRAALCKRPEEMDQQALYGPVWEAVNAHLGQFGIEARSHPELVEQLGILRFGRGPKVGDTFCGGGSIPFEAARGDRARAAGGGRGRGSGDYGTRH